MKTEAFSDALTYLDDDLVSEVRTKRNVPRTAWMGWAAAAALWAFRERPRPKMQARASAKLSFFMMMCFLVWGSEWMCPEGQIQRSQDMTVAFGTEMVQR